MPDLQIIRTPKPTSCTVQTDIGPVKVTYDRNAMALPQLSAAGTLRRHRLSRVLMDWDLTNGGEAWQPHDRADTAHWTEQVREVRAAACVEWEQLRLQRVALTDEAAAKLPPLPPEPTPVDAPVTWEHRANAYALAWRALLDQLPSEFIVALDNGVLDDFLGERPPMSGTVTG